MNSYTIYFEFMGKKMKFNVSAASQHDAESQLMDRLVVHKIKLTSGHEPDRGRSDGLVDDLMKKMFGGR